MVHVVLITRILSGGGAQRQIIETARNLDKGRFRITVVTLYPSGLLSKEVEQIPGVELWSINKKNRYDLLPSTLRFLRLCKKNGVHIIWSYSGGYEYGFAAKLFRRTRLVMGIRHSGLDQSKYGILQRITFKLQALLSPLADIMVANSFAGRSFFADHGFAERRIVVIPNGYDTEQFSYSLESRAKLREEWGYSEDMFVVGLVGRIDPQKDHETFLRAAAKVANGRQDFRFVCVGEGSSELRTQLLSLCDELGISERVLWAGSFNDMPSIYSALDSLVLCSAFGEGTPNVVGEAMSCGVPCIVTDVGDSARLLDDRSRTVSIGDAASLATVMERLADLSPDKRSEIGRRDRHRIEALYSLKLLADRTASVVSGIVQGKSLESVDRDLGSVEATDT